MQRNFQPPVPVDPHHLISSARLSLAAAPLGSPEDRATAHRAVSTAYYAVFHALNANNADAIVGTPTTQRMSEDWIRTYRSTRHRYAANHLTLSPKTGSEQDVTPTGATKKRASRSTTSCCHQNPR